MQKQIVSLLLKAILLFLPVSLVLGFTEYKLRQLPNSYNKKRELLEGQLDSINFIVLGASQSLYGVNPNCFQLKGFNLCNVSQSLYYDTQLAMKYIERMKNLKCIIISTSYYSFWSQLADTKEKWRDYYYYRYWDIKSPQLDMTDPKAYSAIMLYTPEVALKTALRGFDIDLSENLSRNGWVKKDTSQLTTNISEASGKIRVASHDRIRFENRFKEIYSMVDSFLYKCDKLNLEVVFIVPPVLPTYYKNVNQTICNKNEEAIISLTQRHKISYHNYFEDGRFSIEDFFDNDHLNFLGADKFSKILNKDIFEK